MMATRDDVTVRIDTEMRAKARELEINLSRLLEEKLAEEIARREAVAQTLEGAAEIRLDLEDSDGRGYVGKFTGTFLGEGHDVTAYLTDDGRVIFHETDKERFTEVDQDTVDSEMVTGWFPHDFEVATEILYALGQTPEIEI